MAEANDHQRLLDLTGKIVVACAGHQTMPASDLPSLIVGVFAALRTAGRTSSAKASAAGPTPAVPVRKSIQPEFLVCLEDGRRVTMLKRYLQRRYGLTPADYRRRWGLPDDYPMTAPAYAARRSAWAKQLGLGGKRAAATPEPAAEPTTAASRRAGGRPVAGGQADAASGVTPRRCGRSRLGSGRQRFRTTRVRHDHLATRACWHHCPAAYTSGNGACR